MEQHSPSTTYVAYRCRLPYCPYHRPASTRQPRGNSRCQSELRHNHSPLFFLARSLASLISILLSFRALFTPSIPRPPLLLPSTFAFITFFSMHYPSSLHDRTMSKHSQFTLAARISTDTCSCKIQSHPGPYALMPNILYPS